MAVRSTQDRYRAARSTQGVSPSLIVVHVLSLSGIGFQIKYIVKKVRQTTTFCLKHLFCKT